jgi:putative transposase
MKTFVYKLRPSPPQEAIFAETLHTCRRLYNHALHERKTLYTERDETLAFAHQCATLPHLKHTWHSLKRVHSQVLQDVLHRLQHAFDGFFRRVSAGRTPTYPRFRGKGWYDSF